LYERVFLDGSYTPVQDALINIKGIGEHGNR
jgi:hypothetical protein